jgi:hypothetical protein
MPVVASSEMDVRPLKDRDRRADMGAPPNVQSTSEQEEIGRIAR